MPELSVVRKANSGKKGAFWMRLLSSPLERGPQGCVIGSILRAGANGAGIGFRNTPL